LTQVVELELGHATAVPHVPLGVHVCTPVPEHCVEPGTHDPVQAPPTHAEAVHATPVPHAPLWLHVWTLLP
jgi:hypothetical protein